MPILYSAVASEQNIIANFASCDGNFVEITQQILSKMPSDCDKRMTYLHGPYLIHYKVDDNYLYICMTDKFCQRSRAFLFLNQINREYVSNGKENLVKTLADEMYRYSEDYNTIAIRQGELDELNKIGVESSETILGEKMLFINNVENISYATVTYVGKTPETVAVTEERPQLHVLAVVIVGILMLILSAIYSFGPVSCVVVIGVIAVAFKSFVVSGKDKPE